MVKNPHEYQSPEDRRPDESLADQLRTHQVVPRDLVSIANAAVAAGQDQGDAEKAPAHAYAAREEAEMKAAIVLAKRFPRDESTAYTRVMHACDRPTFAESANYCFPRGGQTVTGPSVDLARELARIWGNIRYGMRIVSEDDERVHIKGYAFDLESNTYVEAEDKFAKVVPRRNRATGQTEYLKADERDLRELVNKRGAICVRNAILQLLPSDIIQDAMARSRDTTQKVARGEIQQDREQAIRRLALAYHDIGVTSDMIAGYLKHPMDLITNEEIADLRAIYKSIRDGNSRREEYFRMPSYASRDEFRSRGDGASGSRSDEPRERRPEGTQAAPRDRQPEETPRTASPRPAGRTPARAPKTDHPDDLDQARRNMQHTLEQARRKAADDTPTGEPGQTWEQLAAQAAEHWETTDQAAVLRRLNKEAVTRYGVPLKRLDAGKIAQIETRTASGEITLE